MQQRGRVRAEFFTRRLLRRAGVHSQCRKSLHLAIAPSPFLPPPLLRLSLTSLILQHPLLHNTPLRNTHSSLSKRLHVNPSLQQLARASKQGRIGGKEGASEHSKQKAKPQPRKAKEGRKEAPAEEGQPQLFAQLPSSTPASRQREREAGEGASDTRPWLTSQQDLQALLQLACTVLLWSLATSRREGGSGERGVEIGGELNVVSEAVVREVFGCRFGSGGGGRGNGGLELE